jgi:hypothetical protein
MNPTPETLANDARWIAAQIDQDEEYTNELRSRTIENQARTIALLTKDTQFTRQSIVDAVVGHDLSKLVWDNPNTEPGKIRSLISS